MKQFEYYTKDVDVIYDDPANIQDMLTVLGTQGWELVSTICINAESNACKENHLFTCYKFIFKREI